MNKDRWSGAGTRRILATPVEVNRPVRPRDSQRHLVYRVERRMIEASLAGGNVSVYGAVAGPPFLSIVSVRQYLASLQRDPQFRRRFPAVQGVDVRAGRRGQRRGKGSFKSFDDAGTVDAGLMRMSLPPIGWFRHYVLHEAAHGCSQSAGLVAWHGPEYLRALVDLTRIAAGDGVARALLRLYLAEGCRC